MHPLAWGSMQEGASKGGAGGGGQTDACENVTFPQLRLRAITNKESHLPHSDWRWPLAKLRWATQTGLIEIHRFN